MHIPILHWVWTYKKNFILSDVVAGITIGIMQVSQGESDCVHVCVCACVRACVRACACALECGECLHVFQCPCVCTYVYSRVYACVYMLIRGHVYRCV